MIRIKDFNKISLQKNNNTYTYIHWPVSQVNRLDWWPEPLHINEEGHISLSPTMLVEWCK